MMRAGGCLPDVWAGRGCMCQGKEHQTSLPSLPAARTFTPTTTHLPIHVLPTHLDACTDPLNHPQPAPFAGTNSYVLFTLDKLVGKIVKQLQLVHSDEVGARLVELWRYENARGVEVRWASGWVSFVVGWGMEGLWGG